MYCCIYSSNPDKSYIKSTLSLNGEINKSEITLSISCIPKYVSRAYLDDETNYEQWSSYRKLSGNLEFIYRFTGRYFVSIYGDLSYYRYIDFSPEYDSWKRNISLSLSKGMSPEFEIAYRFLISKARGYDTSVENKQSSNESDISYEKDMFSLVINKKYYYFRT